jgi:TatD DNase family protein
VLADSHVHLEQYPPETRHELIERAQAAGVERLLAVSLSLASSRRTLELVGRWPGVYAAVGDVPGGRLLLETDTYPIPGRTTEPRDLVQVCRSVAELRGEAPEAVARATTAKFARLLEVARVS